MKLRIQISLVSALLAGATVLTPIPALAADFAQQVVDISNGHRAENGCGPLAVNPALARAAQGHSDDMAKNNFMDHTGSDGSSPWQRMTRAGYPSGGGSGENVAAGYQTPKQVVAGWMSSPGHRRNILNCSYKAIGVGYAYGANTTYRHYWTQDFGTKA